MFTRTLCAVIALLCIIGLASQADPPVEGQKPKAVTQKEIDELKGTVPPWKSRGPDGVRAERKRGKVVAVTKQFIEVQGDGEKTATRYLAHEALAGGRVVYWETDAWCYLLDDVKVGDEVCVGTGTIKDTTFAFYLSIEKRPGGKIPPSRKPSDSRPYHEYQQARIDLEEKGTPIPDRLLHPDERKTTQKKDDKK